MCTHLKRRENGRYYIRRRVPLDLIPVLGYKEFSKALGTSDYAEAVTRCRREGVRLDNEWAAVRASTQAKHAITHAKSAAEKPKGHASDWSATSDNRDVADDWDYYYTHVKDEGVEEEEREQFESTVQSRVAVEREVQRRLGNSTTKPTTTAAKPAKSSARMLPDVIDAWARERQPQARTVQIAERCARRFREVVGPVPVASITRQHVIAFKDALLSSGQTAVNTDKILTMLSALLSYGHDQGWTASNPAKGIKVGARSNAKAARLPFDLPALKLLFGSSIYTEGVRPGAGAGEASYWLPLLALYTGARIEELAQLAPGDVHQVPYTDAHGNSKSAWVIRISDVGEGQGVKTATSRRRVPVHPDLISLGFIDYASAAKGARLFPLLKTDTDGREGGLFGKWFGKHIRNLGITDKRMVFHSFRHLLKHTMREAGITEEVSDAITGHASGSVGRRYGATLYPLAPLVDAMSRYRIHGLPLPAPWANSGE
jgi:integrase